VRALIPMTYRARMPVDVEDLGRENRRTAAINALANVAVVAQGGRLLPWPACTSTSNCCRGRRIGFTPKVHRRYRRNVIAAKALRLESSPSARPFPPVRRDHRLKEYSVFSAISIEIASARIGAPSRTRRSSGQQKFFGVNQRYEHPCREGSDEDARFMPR